MNSSSSASLTANKYVWISAALFLVTTMVCFCLWAFSVPFLRGEARLYPAMTLVFILGGAPSMLPVYRSNNGPRGQVKFLLLFFPAFAVFAASWWLCWSRTHSHLGEIPGFLLGLFGFIIVFRMFFVYKRPIFQLLAIAFTWFIPLYYMASYFYEEIGGSSPFARLTWGFFMGIGLGTAFAYVTDSLQVRGRDEKSASGEL